MTTETQKQLISMIIEMADNARHSIEYQLEAIKAQPDDAIVLDVRGEKELLRGIVSAAQGVILVIDARTDFLSARELKAILECRERLQAAIESCDEFLD